MAIEKRISKKSGAAHYRVRLRLRAGGDLSSTHTLLTDARDWEARMRTTVKDGQWTTKAEAQRHTVDEMIDRYLALLPSLRLKDARNRRRHAGWWRHELKGVRLSELTPVRIVSARDRLQSTPIPAQAGQGLAAPRLRQAATVVRYLAALSHMLTIAGDDWGWLESNPMRKVRKPKQAPGRVRYLTDAERVRLLAVCQQSASRALYPVVVVALATGMRKSEILTLRWSQLDLDAGLISLADTKNGERRQIPLVKQALEVMKAWSSGSGSPREYVFPSDRPECPRDITKAWRTASAKAELVDFRFHDLRHTTASYLAMRSASLLEIGQVLGHKSAQVTKRYAHLSVAHTRKILGDMVESMLPSETRAQQEGVVLSAGATSE